MFERFCYAYVASTIFRSSVVSLCDCFSRIFILYHQIFITTIINSQTNVMQHNFNRSKICLQEVGETLAKMWVVGLWMKMEFRDQVVQKIYTTLSISKLCVCVCVCANHMFFIGGRWNRWRGWHFCDLSSGSQMILFQSHFYIHVVYELYSQVHWLCMITLFLFNDNMITLFLFNELQTIAKCNLSNTNWDMTHLSKDVTI